MTTSSHAAVVVMVGPPGSGKSTWCSGRFLTDELFSLDAFRRVLADDVADMSATEPAALMLHTVVRERSRRGLVTVADACNTLPARRGPVVAAAREFGVPVLAVVTTTPPAVCRQRNAQRDGVVAPYPGANPRRVPDAAVARIVDEARANPVRVGEVDAVLTLTPDGGPLSWEGCLPPAVLSAPWLADTMGAPWIPADRVPPPAGRALRVVR
ncbi:AAA family ATPase [Micromonospora sp. RP3T]|uniref:AAA family ATPase n=1 Tax=Micromonospora sp. RP3T TaxID=2135446 RepID=UPI003D763998